MLVIDGKFWLVLASARSLIYWMNASHALPASVYGTDKNRIRIWDIATTETIYDNQMSDPIYSEATIGIEGGSIVLHK